jgi:transcriptional regulator GlxA family with amidase domain/DNA-binding CsgD family transcriptional regulator
MVLLAWDGVAPDELSVPIHVFGRARDRSGAPAYRVLIAAVADRVVAGPLRVRATDGPGALARADTVVVPGAAGPDPPPEPLVRALRAARSRGARVVAMCAGVEVVADAGLLDGRRAAAPEPLAAELSRRHPAVRFGPAAHVEDGGVLTCATATAGLDLCLHVVSQDLGREVAAETARALEVSVADPPARGPGPEPADDPDGGGSLEPLLTWMHENIDRDLTLDDLAARAGVSKRTLTRRFGEEVGTSPARWLQQTRLRLAQQLLETTALPVERIARDVGFGSPTTFREGFRSVFGVSPHAYRHDARRAEPPPEAPEPTRRPDPPLRPARPTDIGDLRAAVPDLVAAVIAAARSVVDDAPPHVREAITEHLHAVVPRIVPVVVDALEHDRPLSGADLALFRTGGADIARRGVPLLHSLRGVGPALAVFTRLVLHGTAAVPVASRALLLARAAQIAHRMALEIAAGYLQATTVVPTPAPAAGGGPQDADRLDEVDDVDRMMLDLVVQGRSNDHIARATSYSPQTVRWRLSRLMRRWSVPNRAALAVAAVRRGALPPPPDRPTGASGDGPVVPSPRPPS